MNSGQSSHLILLTISCTLAIGRNFAMALLLQQLQATRQETAQPSTKSQGDAQLQLCVFQVLYLFNQTITMQSGYSQRSPNSSLFLKCYAVCVNGLIQRLFEWDVVCTASWGEAFTASFQQLLWLCREPPLTTGLESWAGHSRGLRQPWLLEEQPRDCQQPGWFWVAMPNLL